VSTSSKTIEEHTVGWRGDPYMLSTRAQELWRWRWLMQDHIPGRPATREPAVPIIGGWRNRGQ